MSKIPPSLKIHRDKIVNRTFRWAARVRRDCALQNWIENAIKWNDEPLMNAVFDEMRIPDNLTLKQRLALYALGVYND